MSLPNSHSCILSRVLIICLILMHLDVFAQSVFQECDKTTGVKITSLHVTETNSNHEHNIAPENSSELRVCEDCSICCALDCSTECNSCGTLMLMNLIRLESKFSHTTSYIISNIPSSAFNREHFRPPILNA